MSGRAPEIGRWAMVVKKVEGVLLVIVGKRHSGGEAR